MNYYYRLSWVTTCDMHIASEHVVHGWYFDHDLFSQARKADKLRCVFENKVRHLLAASSLVGENYDMIEVTLKC